MAEVLINMQSRIRHAELLAAARKHGTGTSLAAHLNVTRMTLYAWINFRSCPFRESKVYDYSDVEDKLFHLTGKSMGELWPEDLKGFIRSKPEVVKEEEQIVITDWLLAVKIEDQLTLPSPDEIIIEKEKSEIIHDALRKMTNREREVIKLCYGLGPDGLVHTLEEIGRIFKVTRERVRQIQRIAIRKLKDGPAGKDLREYFRKDE